MRHEHDWSKYKEGLHLLLLSKEKEQKLIEILECSLATAISLPEEELLNRKNTLQILIEKYGKLLKKECYELFYVLGNMESNYRYVLELKENGESNE